MLGRGKLMAYTVFLPLMLCFSYSCSAQIRLENISLQLKKKIMYGGWDNIIQVQPNDSINSYRLESSSSSIYLLKGYKNSFRVRNRRLGYDTLRLFLKGKLIKEEIYEVRKKPRNQGPYLISENAVELSVKEILNDPKIHCSKFHTLVFPCEVISFTIAFIPSDTTKEITVKKNMSSIISDENLEEIKLLKKGSRIFIEDISARHIKQNDIRRLPSFTIKIH